MNSDVKIVRKFTKYWGDMYPDFCEYGNSLDVLIRYAQMLKDIVFEIDKNEDQTFDMLSSTPISDYKLLIDIYYNKLLNLTFKRDYLNQIGDEFNAIKREKYTNTSQSLKVENFVYDEFGVAVGIKDDYFKNFNSIAKKLYMFEKVISHTTKQIWENEITLTANLDLNKPFKLIVKTVFPQTWRFSGRKEDIDSFGKQKYFQSASLISDEKPHALYLYHYKRICALLVYKYEKDKFIVADHHDIRSSEFINRNNPYEEFIIYDPIEKIYAEKVDGRVHDLFAQATEIATPNYVLSKSTFYNEVVLKNPKVEGVLAPNECSVDYAKSLAKQLKQPYLGKLNTCEQEMSFNSEN